VVCPPIPVLVAAAVNQTRESNALTTRLPSLMTIAITGRWSVPRSCCGQDSLRISSSFW